MTHDLVVFPALADPCSKHLALGDLATLPLLSRLLPPRGTHVPQVEPQPRPQAMLESSTMLEDIFKLPESMLGSSMLGSALPRASSTDPISTLHAIKRKSCAAAS